MIIVLQNENQYSHYYPIFLCPFLIFDIFSTGIAFRGGGNFLIFHVHRFDFTTNERAKTTEVSNGRTTTHVFLDTDRPTDVNVM